MQQARRRKTSTSEQRALQRRSRFGARALHWLFGAALALPMACSGHGEPYDDPEVAATAQDLSPARQSFIIDIPSGMSASAVALGASSALKVGSNARVEKTGGGFAPVFSTGPSATATEIGSDAQVGDVTSSGPVTLRDRARVNGNATSGGSITPSTTSNGVVVTGVRSPNTPIALDRLSFTVNFPASGPSPAFPQNQTVTLAPGAYGAVRVPNGSTLALRSGNYFVDELTVEPEARLALDTAAGTVYLYARTNFVFRGTTSFSGPNDRFFVGYIGTTSPALDRSPQATFVAPNASMRLGVGGSPYIGAFFARALEIDPSVRFTHRANAGWAGLRYDVVPTLACVERRADSSFAAVLGYYNPNPRPMTLAVGPTNRFSPSPENHGQPTTFLPGRFPSAFSVDFGSATALTFQLDGHSLPIARTAVACPSSATHAPLQDVSVNAAAPRANTGSAQRLALAPGKHTLVQFDRARVKREIGTGRYVTKAELQLTRASGGAPLADALLLNRPFTERGATWNCSNDTNTTDAGEACAFGDEWELEREDAIELNPWTRRSAERRVSGTWNGSTLSFDVTRDVQNLIGADGLRKGMAWALVLDAAASASAELFSREAGVTPPRLVLTLGTLPEVNPGALAPLSFGVDNTLVPGADLPGYADGAPRRLATFVDGKGRSIDFVERELVFAVNDTSELGPVLARYAGQIVHEIEPPPVLPGIDTLAVVRIDPSRAQPDALLPRIRELDHRFRGAHRFSSAAGLATLAAAAEEALAGRRVLVDWILEPAQSVAAWQGRDIFEGTFDPTNAAVDIHGGFSSSPFLWPGFASYDPDPASSNLPAPNLNTFNDGVPIRQTMGVAEAWRALALSDRLRAERVRVSIVDGDFRSVGMGPFTGFDYPPFNPSGDENKALGTIVRHGDQMVHVGFSRVGNGIGIAGPGGPVTSLDIRPTTFSYSDIQEKLGDAWFANSRIVSMSLSGAIPAVGTLFAGYDDFTGPARGYGMLMFAAAGNDGENVDAEDCIGPVCWEENATHPCENDGVDCVAGLGFDDYARFSGSNYGSEHVDLAAPWFAFRVAGATTFDNMQGGTSSATAFTSGSAALIMSATNNVMVDGWTPERAQTANETARCLYSSSEPVHRAGRHFDVLASVRCMVTGSPAGDMPGFLRIEEPLDGATLPPEFARVRAVAGDYEAGTPTIGWSSNVDGFLGATGPDQAGNLFFRTLGTHLLTASALGSNGQVMSQTITVNVVRTAPDLVIVEPANDGASFPAGLPVSLIASASGWIGFTAPNEAFMWQSVAADGSLDFSGAIGRTIQPSFTRLGAHTVTVSFVTPGTGEVVTATRVIEIVATTDLAVQITSPPLRANGKAHVFRDEILALAATSTRADVTYQWYLTVGSVTTPIFSGQVGSWDPRTLINRTCTGTDTILRVVATDGTGATAQDVIPLFVGATLDDIVGCVR